MGIGTSLKFFAKPRAISSPLVLLDPFGNVMGWNVLPGPAEYTDPLFILEAGDGFILVGSCWDEGDYYTADAFVEFIDHQDIPEDR